MSVQDSNENLNSQTEAPPESGYVNGENTLLVAELYLEALDPTGPKFVFQTYDDNEERKKTNAPNDPLAHIYVGTWTKYRTLLTQENAKGASICVTVNHTVGGREKDDLRRIRAVFCEWDDKGPMPDWPLDPHIIVETSPGHFHFYWLTDDMEPDDFDRFMAVMVHKYGSDKAAKDRVRVLRIPGFWHQKGEPWCVQLTDIQDRDDLPPYTSSELLAAFGVAEWEQDHPPEEPEPDEPRAQSFNPMSDDEILALANAAENSEKFARLWRGDATLWTEEPKVYESQSNADQALCCMLAFYCGNDPARIDRLFKLSGLYRQDKWERHDYAFGTIRKAIARAHPFFSGVREVEAEDIPPDNDAPDEDDPPTEGASSSGNPDDFVDDAKEYNTGAEAKAPAQETADRFPCPPHLFRGIFAVVAEATGRKNWETWLATLVALGAYVHKNITLYYHRPLYGMVYGLLLNGTGLGKGRSTDLCRALLTPGGYFIREHVASGQALAPILADITRDSKGKVESVDPHPALLLIEEFTGLLKNSGIPHSTILEVINGLFHQPFPWSFTRTDRPNSGGGDLVIDNPILSILATTTQTLFKEQVTLTMIRGGFLNRFLVLPGDTTPWKFYDPDGAKRVIDPRNDLFKSLSHHKMNIGKSVWDVYASDALERMVSWGQSLFEPLMQSTSLEDEGSKRLHVYSHIIS